MVDKHYFLFESWSLVVWFHDFVLEGLLFLRADLEQRLKPIAKIYFLPLQSLFDLLVTYFCVLECSGFGIVIVLQVNNEFFKHCNFIIALIPEILILLFCCSSLLTQLSFILISHLAYPFVILLFLVGQSLQDILLLQLIVVLQLLQRLFWLVAQLWVLLARPLHSNLQLLLQNTNFVLVVALLTVHCLIHLFEQFLFLSIEFLPLFLQVLNYHRLVPYLALESPVLQFKLELILLFRLPDICNILLMFFFGKSELRFQLIYLRKMQLIHLAELSFIGLP
jgi:hypothetical protein